MIIIIIITYLTRVNPSAEAVINGCPGQLRNKQFKEKITITAKLSEKCKNYVQKIFTEKKVFQRSLQFSRLWFRINVRDGQRKQGKRATLGRLH